MNRKVGKYDYEDPFIDDAELQWEEEITTTKEGFLCTGVRWLRKDQQPKKEPVKVKVAFSAPLGFIIYSSKGESFHSKPSIFLCLLMMMMMFHRPHFPPTPFICFWTCQRHLDTSDPFMNFSFLTRNKKFKYACRVGKICPLRYGPVLNCR